MFDGAELPLDVVDAFRGDGHHDVLLKALHLVVAEIGVVDVLVGVFVAVGLDVLLGLLELHGHIRRHALPVLIPLLRRGRRILRGAEDDDKNRG